MHPPTSLLPATVALVLGASAVWTAAAPDRPTFLGAVAAYNRGEFATSAAACRRLLAAHPADADVTALLGWCLLRQARRDEARACFEAALASVPGHASAGAGLAWIDPVASPPAGAAP